MMKKAGLLLGAVLLLGAGVQNWFAYSGVYWDDLRAPASIILLGAGSGVSADRATDGSLLFATNQDEEAIVIMQLPHTYLAGSNLHAHVHWGKNTSAAGDVCWAIDYECMDIGETFTAAWTTTGVGMEYIVDDSDTAYRHAYAEAAAFDPACSGVSCICKFRVWRDVDGGSCTGTPSDDDYATDARLYEFDVHFQSDQPGSVSEATKYN